MKWGIQIDHPAVQSCRHGQHLKRGPRFITVGEDPVTPLFQPCRIQLLPVDLQTPLIGFRSFRCHQAFHFQLLDPGRGFRVRHFQVIVRVIAAQSSHRQDLTGLGIHHQAKGPVLHIVTVNGLLHPVFQAGLNGGIQRQDHTVAGSGCDKPFIGERHIHLIVSFGSDDLSGAAFQKTIICRLHTFRAGIGGIGKSDHLGR